MSGSPKTTPI